MPTLQGQECRLDQPTDPHVRGGGGAAVERLLHRRNRQRCHRHRHQAFAQVAVRIQLASGGPPNFGSSDIDRIGDQRGGGIGSGGVAGEHGNGICNAEGQAASAAPAGGDAAHRLLGGQFDLGVERRAVDAGDDTDLEAAARGQMDGDVAAVVDIGALQPAPSGHRRQHMVGHRPRHRGHRRHELGQMRQHGRQHAPRHRPPQRQIGRGRSSQRREFRDQLGQDASEAVQGLAVGRRYLVGRTEGLEHEVDGAVLQMQPAAVGQECGYRARHSRCPHG